MNTRYIPENSQPIERAGLPAVVYAYTSTKDGKPAAIAYIGKSGKPVWHYRFMNEAQREARINQLFEGVAQRKDFKLARKRERMTAHSLKVGDILYASWGYDQTNIEFFQITAVTEKTVTFGEIAQNVEAGSRGFMCEDVTARPGSFLNETRYTRRATGDNHVTFAEHEGGYKRHLSKYDGRPLYQSHYA